MVCRSGILGQLECCAVEKEVMKVGNADSKNVGVYLDGKLVTTYGWAEKDGIPVEQDPIFLENT